MGIKSDKTFEEIVERLVAIFRPQPPPESDQATEVTSTVPADTVQDTPSSPVAPATQDD